MSDSKIGRRDATRRFLTVLGVASVAPVAWMGCGDEDGGSLTCTDTTGLEAAQVEMRQTQSYVDLSTTEGETCESCRFFTAGQAGACGTCQVIQGPVHPAGTCDLWAALA